MNERSKDRFSPPAVGGVTLLSVFAILCLTIFALLSLSTIQANGRLADASAQAMIDYYNADTKAEEILARLRGSELPGNAEALPDNDTLNGIHVNGNIYSYLCKISDTQNLEVSVQLNGADYTILSWKTVPAGEWKADNNLYVWDGETETNSNVHTKGKN